MDAWRRPRRRNWRACSSRRGKGRGDLQSEETGTDRTTGMPHPNRGSRDRHPETGRMPPPRQPSIQNGNQQQATPIAEEVARISGLLQGLMTRLPPVQPQPRPPLQPYPLGQQPPQLLPPGGQGPGSHHSCSEGPTRVFSERTGGQHCSHYEPGLN